jgi:hypothetical protein
MTKHLATFTRWKSSHRIYYLGVYRTGTGRSRPGEASKLLGMSDLVIASGLQFIPTFSVLPELAD